MVTYSQLNENQKSAVCDEANHLRIIAGAGSGKTRVLTMRIAYLIEQKGVKPYHILAITFTNKAAREMKYRIADMLKEQGTGCHISTIHSLCMRILAEDIGALNYPRNFTVIDADEEGGESRNRTFSVREEPGYFLRAHRKVCEVTPKVTRRRKFTWKKN